MSSLEPLLAVSLLADVAESIDAPEMYKAIVHKFTNTNGGLEEIAVGQFMQFVFKESVGASENLFRFNQVCSRNTALGVTIPEDLQVTELLDPLSRNQDGIKQAWMARKEEDRTVAQLKEAIEGEALRRGQYNAEEMTALFSRMNTSRRPNFRSRGNFRREFNSRRTVTSSSDVVCYNCNGRGHFRSQCTAPRRRSQQQQEIQQHQRQPNRQGQRDGRGYHGERPELISLKHQLSSCLKLKLTTSLSTTNGL
jgi:hypothetical protein